MKTRILSLPTILLVVIAVGISPVMAQKKKAVADQVEALLLKFPAESATKRDAAADELLTLGTAGVGDLCRRLVAPGAADDSLVRFALDAVIVRSSRPGAEKERVLVVGGLLKSLDEAKDPENTAFLIALLQLTGRAEIVGPLVRYLQDPVLSGPAVRALVATKTRDAEAALVKALATGHGESAAAIIQGLGDLKCRAATKPLLLFAEGNNSKIRSAALDALANIGEPAARSVLEQVRVTAPPEERARAASRLLLWARRQAESGKSDAALQVAKSLLTNYTAPGESRIRAAALMLYLETAEETAGLDALMDAAQSSDREFRQKALDIVAGLTKSWSAEPWIKLLDQTTPDIQADLIRLLARRGEKSALSVIREKLRSDQSEVRQAAAGAAAGLGGAEVIAELIPLLKSGDEAETQAVKAAFLTFPTDVLLPQAAALLPEVPAVSQIALLEILAERRAKAQVGAVLSLTVSENEKVRAAALIALEQTVSEKDLPALIDLLLLTTAAPEIAWIQNAVVVAAGQIPDLEQRSAPLLKALEQSTGAKRIDLIRPLAKIGGGAALKVVLAEMNNPDPQVQAVAVFTLANWPDADVLDELFELARTTIDRKSRYLALQGIARLVPASGLPSDRKHAMMTEALPLTVETNEKVVVLNGLAVLRTPEALDVVAKFLDDPSLQVRAAQAMARLIQPGIGVEGMKGFPAAVTLKKALLFMDNEYDRAEAERYAHGLLLREGFKLLFNDKDLSGWKGLVADPPKRSGMTPAALTKAQAEADVDMRAHWRVIEGVLSFDGKGHSLCTRQDYGDFEMFVDWKIEPQGDSGIYLRGSPQVQIWDPAQGTEGSGGLYNNQKNPNKPAVKADRPVGEWNTFHIKMIGERVTVTLNGVPVVDNVLMENYWERDKPIYPVGQIELQAHSTPLQFKNIYLREIPADGRSDSQSFDAELSVEEKAEGFVPLFNGRDLKGWTGDQKGYVVENGAIVVSPGGGENLYTEKEYADFHLRFEFKLTPGANNGIGIRGPFSGDAAYVGMEIQVLDDSADIYKDLKPYQYHGSIYGLVPAKRGFQNPVGEWNTEEIIARGRKVTVILNGTTIVEADLDGASNPATIDGRDHPGLKRAAGYISFCGHGSRVEFRNLRIKIL